MKYELNVDTYENLIKTENSKIVLIIEFSCRNYFVNAHFGPDVGPIWLGNVRCSGNETDIAECESNMGWGIIYCSHGEDAGVHCGE